MLFRSLVIWRPAGLLDADRVTAYLDFLERVEREHRGARLRLNDFSLVTEVDVDYAAVSDAARRRRESRERSGETIRVAFFAPTALAFGLSRMYQQLAASASFEIEVFDAIEDATGWLGVDARVLTSTPPPRARRSGEKGDAPR